jgi:hypothetical protein
MPAVFIFGCELVGCSILKRSLLVDTGVPPYPLSPSRVESSCSQEFPGKIRDAKDLGAKICRTKELRRISGRDLYLPSMWPRSLCLGNVPTKSGCGARLHVTRGLWIFRLRHRESSCRIGPACGGDLHTGSRPASFLCQRVEEAGISSGLQNRMQARRRRSPCPRPY